MVVDSLSPSCRRSFLTNIQKLEGMLKSWFPHVSDADDHVLAKRQKVDSG